ncbi:MAG: amidohydrolase family protein [Azospirillaceae bacterium]
MSTAEPGPGRLDHVIAGATHWETGECVDIAIADGRIAAITPSENGSADPQGPPRTEAAGWLASPAFVEPHYHMTSCFVPTDGLRDMAFEDQIEDLGRKKRAFTLDDTIERVERVGRIMAARGVVAVRSFADTDSHARMVCFEALREARRRLAGVLDIRIIAFPQHGLISDPGARDLAIAALEAGAEYIGTNPQLERSDALRRQEIREVFELAERYGVDVDFHCDETDRPESRWLEVVVDETLARGFHGRVTVAHCMSLPKQDEAYRRRLYDRMREAGIAVASSPMSGLLYGGVGAIDPPRGIATIKELVRAGVPVAIAQEAYGSMFAPYLLYPDPVMSGQVMAYAAKLFSAEDLVEVWRMITTHAAAMAGRRDYGLAVGASADLVLLRADSAADALTTLAPARRIYRDGRLVAESCYEDVRLDA